MIEIQLTHYLILSAIIFTTGIVGIFINRKNVIINNVYELDRAKQ